jgi:hypothetical protein
MAVDPFLMGILFGFLPAMGFLYIILHNYQSLFDEKRIFKAFVIGLVVGLFVTILQSVLAPGQALNPDSPDAANFSGVLLIALLLGTMDALAGAAVLNWRSYRGRRDTPFYGIAVGLGFGAVNAVFLVGRSVPALTAGAVGAAEAFLFVLLGCYFIGSILVHAGAYVMVGQGAALGTIWKQTFRASLVLGAYSALFLILPRVPDWLANMLPLLALASAIAFIAWIMDRVLDRIVPDDVLREAGIHRRRLARSRMRQTSSQQEEATGPRLKDETVADERGK